MSFYTGTESMPAHGTHSSGSTDLDELLKDGLEVLSTAEHEGIDSHAQLAI